MGLGMKASGQSTATASQTWWATRTPIGPASLHLQADGPQVVAEAWGRERSGHSNRRRRFLASTTHQRISNHPVA